MKRSLSVFLGHGDILTAEYELHGFNERTAKQIFGPSPADPYYLASYPVTPQTSQQILNFLPTGFSFDFEASSYFVEAYEDEEGNGA